MIDKKEVEHIAYLARLNFSPSEIETLTQQLNTILNYFEQLQELDTSGIEPTSHVIPLYNVFREDIIKGSPPLEKNLSNAPDKKEDFFRVPKIIE